MFVVCLTRDRLNERHTGCVRYWISADLVDTSLQILRTILKLRSSKAYRSGMMAPAPSSGPAEAQPATRPPPTAVDPSPPDSWPFPIATSEIRLMPLAPSQKSRGRGRGRPRRQALALANRQGIPSAAGGIRETSQDQRGFLQAGGSDARFEKAAYTWLCER